MSALLQAELLKLRTTRTFATLVGVAVALSLLVVVLTGLLQSDFRERDVRNLFAGDFTGLFILLLGVMGMAGEWRHRTITSSVLAAPDRLRLLAAKVISYTVAGAVLSLIVPVTIMIVGTIILSSRDEMTLDAVQLLDVMWRNLVTAAFLGALG
ncbi:MAG: type transport system permease protein, partial [Solirubrobacteraceae bacterium]|nr:type transport system permease protein [Solirubrobacteraceae bacterium]